MPVSPPRRRVLRPVLGVLLGALVLASAVRLVGPAADAADLAPDGRPVPPGGVALTWSPAYMTDSHAFTLEQARAMATRYDLVAAMPAAFQSYSAAMREANPDLTLLAYANATLASASASSGLPESAFAHDVSGRRIESPDWGEHLMESSSPAWRDRADWTCQDRARRGGYDGCLVDMLTLGIFADAGLAEAIPVNPDTGRPYTQLEYRQQMIELAAHYRIASPHLIHLGNSVENAYRYWQSPIATSRPLANSQPGAQMEDFLRGAFNPVDRFPSAADWVRNVDVIRDMEGNDTVGLFSTKLWVPATDAQVARWQAYAMATFLMGADGGSYLSFSRSRDRAGVLGSNVPYEMPDEIGTPLGGMEQRAGGVWTRTFTGGLSVVNPTTAPVTVALPAPLRTLDGRTVTSLTLPASSGDVLLGDLPGSTPTPGPTETPTSDPTSEPTVDPEPDPEPPVSPAPDTTAPVVSIVRAAARPGVLRYAGRVGDNRAVRRVVVAVRNERTGRWRHADRSWGRYAELGTRLLSAGARSSGWRKRLLVRPGRYGVSVVGIDGAGNRSTIKPWRVVVVQRRDRSR